MKGSKVRKILAATLVAAMAISNVATLNVDAVSPSSQTKAAAGSGAKVPEKDLTRKLIGYFPEWAYKTEVQGYYDVADLQWDDLTHIQYSFAMVDEKTNKIKFGDKVAAVEETFANHKMYHKGKEIKIDPSLPYKGHFNILTQMKKMYPDVKVIISIGGWAGSRGFYTMMDTDAGIETFADSAVDFIRQYGFDGVDIDFEYPSSTATSGNPNDADVSEPRRAKLNERYNVLMRVLREKLDAASAKDKKVGDDKYVLSAAVTASSWVLGGVPDNSYASYLDFLSVMSYDFHGGWNHYVENLANIYSDPNDTETLEQVQAGGLATLSMDWAYRFYRGALPPEKILMGIPYYTRGWEGVTGGNGTGLHGTAGSKQKPTPASGKYNLWGDDDDKDGKPDPAGANPLWHVLNLMDKDPKFQKHWDDVGKVPYVWQPDDKVFLSFEDEQSIDERVKYINNNNLGGALIWVMNGDYSLNPNYDKNSNDPNKGKYTFGDTLTKKLSGGLKKMGDAKDTSDAIPGLKTVDVDIKFEGKYDHPNYYGDIYVTNNTGADINGFNVSFDLPKSSIFVSTQASSFTQEDVGDFNRITLNASGWMGNLPKGAQAKIPVTIKLCFGGIKNLTFNGMKPANQPDENNNYVPTISGATDASINVGDAFNPLAGIKATDKEDGDITSKIKITGAVNTNAAGYYTLTYTVTDSNGATDIRERVIEVRPQIEAGYVWWDANTDYKAGQKVAYKGKYYECISWWIPNRENPTDTKYWKYIKDIEMGPVGTPEDVNGDKVVDIRDLSAVAAAYNAKQGTSAYKVNLDVNLDGIIDIYDIVKVGRKL
ncbi:MAG: glycosyl hydrolase family 18 protein [Clostridium sp.]